MDILYLLIPLSVLLVFVIGGLFWWALNNRQFDDLEQQGERILHEDEPSAQADKGEPEPQLHDKN